MADVAGRAAGEPPGAPGVDTPHGHGGEGGSPSPRHTLPAQEETRSTENPTEPQADGLGCLVPPSPQIYVLMS